MNKVFRVYFENKDRDENYWHELPTLEEAQERKELLEEQGYQNVKIEEIRI